MSRTSQTYACLQCKGTYLATGSTNPGFFDGPVDVNCPKDGTLLGTIRDDMGILTVEATDAPAGVMFVDWSEPEELPDDDGDFMDDLED